MNASKIKSNIAQFFPLVLFMAITILLLVSKFKGTMVGDDAVLFTGVIIVSFLYGLISFTNISRKIALIGIAIMLNSVISAILFVIF